MSQTHDNAGCAKPAARTPQQYYYDPSSSTPGDAPPMPVPLPPLSNGIVQNLQLRTFDPATQGQDAYSKLPQQRNTNAKSGSRSQHSRTPAQQPVIPLLSLPSYFRPGSSGSLYSLTGQRPTSSTITGATSSAQPNMSQSRPQPQPHHGHHAMQPQATFESAIVHAAANALLPAQSLLESAWQIMVHRVQMEMNRLSCTLTGALEAEKVAHNRTREVCGCLRREIDGIRAEKAAWSQEKAKLTAQVEGSAKEIERLQKENNVYGIMWEEWDIVRSVRGGMGNKSGECSDTAKTTECRPEGSNSLSDVVEMVRAQYHEEIETRVAKLLAQMHDEKAMRIAAERKLDHVIEDFKARIAVATRDDIKKGAKNEDLILPTDSRLEPWVNATRENDQPSVKAMEVIDLTARPVTPLPHPSPHHSLPTPSSPSPDKRFRSPPVSPPLVSPGLQNVMGSLGVDRRRLESGSQDGQTSRSDESRPLKRSRTEFEKDGLETCRKNSKADAGDVGDVRMAVDCPDICETSDRFCNRTAGMQGRGVAQCSQSKSTSDIGRGPVLLPVDTRERDTTEAVLAGSATLCSPATGAQERQDAEPAKRQLPLVNTPEHGLMETVCEESVRPSSPMDTRDHDSSKAVRVEPLLSQEWGSTRTACTATLVPQRQSSQVDAQEHRFAKARKIIGPQELSFHSLDAQATCPKTPRTPAFVSTRSRPDSLSPKSSSVLRGSQLGISHIDLLYVTLAEEMVCRICLSTRYQQAGSDQPPARFDLKASWADLMGHCEKEHPTTCESLEKMNNVQLIELRQRLSGGKLILKQ